MLWPRTIALLDTIKNTIIPIVPMFKLCAKMVGNHASGRRI